MRTEVIREYRIDNAAKRIIKEISVSGVGQRNKVIYFDGWDGLGASAVLREVARLLNDLNVDVGDGDVPELLRAIHVDCAKWESRRALQRALAMQLELPTTVMKVLDTQDEEDDYLGIPEGRRAEIPEVSLAISRHVQRKDITFVVIFHNGSDEEVDLNSLGFPLSGEFTRHKVLWSFQGRFRLYPRTKVHAALTKTTSMTDLYLSAKSDDSTRANDHKMIMMHEAQELMHNSDLSSIINSPATAAINCLRYITKVCRMGNDLIDYDLATHGFNYCICDDAIQLQQKRDIDGDSADDRLWLWFDILQHEMRLDTDYYHNHSPALVPVDIFLDDRMAFWASPTYGFMLIPASQRGRIHQGTFLPFDRLSVLKLSNCVFSFKSPPFLCCHRLRFLWIDSCQCQEEKGEEAAGEDDLIRQCFQRLWVLVVQNTPSSFLSTKRIGFLTQVRELNVMGQKDRLGLFQGQLPNVKKLRVVESYVTTDDLPLGMDKLDLLNFSDVHPTLSLPVVSGSRSLTTIIIQGNKNAIHFVNISLKGCVNLRNIFLSGLFPHLYSLDISGTVVKTLDLSEVQVPALDNIFLFGCGNLCAILWPSPEKRRRNLGNLGIDTIRTDYHDASRSTPWPAGFGWYIAARDARLLRSLEALKDDLDRNYLHLDISTTMLPSSQPTPDTDSSKYGRSVMSIIGNQEVQVSNNMQQQPLQSNNNNTTVYTDVVAAQTFKNDKSTQQQASDDREPPDVMFVCPPPSLPTSQGCYIHLEDDETMSSQPAGIIISGVICDSSNTLHIHDSPSAISILPSSSAPTLWGQLEWCRVERCPKLKCVFDSPQVKNKHLFNKLITIWVSCLPDILCIRKCWPLEDWMCVSKSFMRNLTFLHLDRCPRLIYVFSAISDVNSLASLETLEITFCGDLHEVLRFSLDVISSIHEFPNLKRIHLHELPKLQSIWNKKIYVVAPKLDTIKIRGCWSLKRLPFVVSGKNTVLCDCEKEWWDALEWGYKRYERIHREDSKNQWSSKDHAESYKPTHPRYYKKKTLLRGSMLR